MSKQTQDCINIKKLRERAFIRKDSVFKKIIVMINLGIVTGQYCVRVKNTDGDNSQCFCFWAFLSLPRNFKLPEKLFTDQYHTFGNFYFCKVGM